MLEPKSHMAHLVWPLHPRQAPLGVKHQMEMEQHLAVQTENQYVRTKKK